MNPQTGEIYRETTEAVKTLEKSSGCKFITLTERQYDELYPQTPARRKNWMRNKPCPCNSGRKFKRCCWSKYE